MGIFVIVINKRGNGFDYSNDCSFIILAGSDCGGGTGRRINI